MLMWSRTAVSRMSSGRLMTMPIAPFIAVRRTSGVTVRWKFGSARLGIAMRNWLVRSIGRHYRRARRRGKDRLCRQSRCPLWNRLAHATRFGRIRTTDVLGARASRPQWTEGPGAGGSGAGGPRFRAVAPDSAPSGLRSFGPLPERHRRPPRHGIRSSRSSRRRRHGSSAQNWPEASMRTPLPGRILRGMAVDASDKTVARSADPLVHGVVALVHEERHVLAPDDRERLDARYALDRLDERRQGHAVRRPCIGAGAECETRNGQHQHDCRTTARVPSSGNHAADGDGERPANHIAVGAAAVRIGAAKARPHSPMSAYPPRPMSM